ncbi:MAG: magnesium/cobalt transporter CorA [Candidatus Eisenbacteria bacterium]
MNRARHRQAKGRLTGKRRSKKAGLPPGSLVHIGEKRREEVVISFLDYDAEQLHERTMAAVGECFALRDTATVSWINVDGLHDVEVVRALCERFGIHPLVQEDILNTDQRPKMEDFGDYLYCVLDMLHCRPPHHDVQFEQVSLILGKNFVLSFQEDVGDVFDPVRERIRKNQGAVRKSGPDYLAYRLIDAIVDNYFSVGERLGERIETLEETLLDRSAAEALHELHQLKRETIRLRKAVWPMREVMAAFTRGESALLKATTAMYYRDVYDHCVQMIDTVETYRDLLSGLLDLYLSIQNNKLNETMKVLAVISTIFIPLSFVAGVYGMNFEWMPELHWRYGYPFVLGGMALVGFGFVYWFRRKRWI